MLCSLTLRLSESFVEINAILGFFTQQAVFDTEVLECCAVLCSLVLRRERKFHVSLHNPDVNCTNVSFVESNAICSRFFLFCFVFDSEVSTRQVLCSSVQLILRRGTKVLLKVTPFV